MPHAVFSPGQVEATGDLVPRMLIPGVEPGMGVRNIFAQNRMKPALLIQDCWLEIEDMAPSDIDDYHASQFFLKLSQETDLTPGLILPVADVSHSTADAASGAAHSTKPTVRNLFNAQGSVWAPRIVGIRVVETGTISITPHVHLDYEVVQIPWQEWFLKWEHLDGLIDNTREY